MTPTPKRRWPRFTLRTLFAAVTVLGMGLGWVVYQLDWIRQRRDIIARPDILSWSRFSVEPLAQPPWPLRPFGARGFYLVSLIIVDDDRAITNEMDVTADDSRLTPKERDEVLKLGRLFPEASAGAWFRKGPSTPNSDASPTPEPTAIPTNH
jgi:hypothetical protein